MVSGLVTDTMSDTVSVDARSAVGAAFRHGTVAAAGFDVTYYEACEGEPLLCLPGAGGAQMRTSLDLLAKSDSTNAAVDRSLQTSAAP